MAARDMTRLKICLVIPAYNEEKRISETLDSFKAALLRKYRGMTILVCVQGTDGTSGIVSRYQKASRRIRLIDCRDSYGKGLNLIRGFKEALRSNPDVIGFTDADSSVPPKEIMKLLEALGEKEVQGVIASRYKEGGDIEGDLTASRWLASRAYNLMIRVLFGLDFSDTQCGAKFFKVGALRTIMRDVRLTDMSFDINLLYEMKIRNLEVREVPITYYIQNEGSKVRVGRVAPRMFIVAISYRISHSFLNRLIPPRFKSGVYHWLKGRRRT